MDFGYNLPDLFEKSVQFVVQKIREILLEKFTANIKGNKYRRILIPKSVVFRKLFSIKTWTRTNYF